MRRPSRSGRSAPTEATERVVKAREKVSACKYEVQRAERDAAGMLTAWDLCPLLRSRQPPPRGGGRPGTGRAPALGTMDVKNAKSTGASVFETLFETPKQCVSAF